MAKINFTKEHFEKLKAYAVEMLFSNEAINTNLGQPLSIVELLHTTTINTLNSIRLTLSKGIETIENQDEWVSGETLQRKLENLKAKKELVNLIIGYKRFTQEQAEIAGERASPDSRNLRKLLRTRLRSLKVSCKHLIQLLSNVNSVTYKAKVKS